MVCQLKLESIELGSKLKWTTTLNSPPVQNGGSLFANDHQASLLIASCREFIS